LLWSGPNNKEMLVQLQLIRMNLAETDQHD